MTKGKAVKTRPYLLAALLLGGAEFFPAAAARAVDGVHEINQTCAVNTGCFPGDAAGFPVTVTESGSYRLTSNLDSGAAVVDMVRIQANHVDFDLNGFSVVGPQTCSFSQGSVVCALAAPFAHRLVTLSGSHNTLRNGSVRGSMNTGVELTAPGPHLVERIHISENGDNNFAARGLLVISGTAAVVRNSIASVNPGEGFQGTSATRFDGNMAYRSGNRRFIVGLCSNNTAAENGTDYQSCTDLGGNSP